MKKSGKKYFKILTIVMMQDFPSFHSVQSQLYKERHSFVPRSQFCRFMVDQSSNETIIKGDMLILDIVTHRNSVMGHICPKLWTQFFIICAEVEE